MTTTATGNPDAPPITARRAADAFTRLRTGVNEELARFLETGARAFDSPNLAAVHELLRKFVLDGGKRLRPLFCYCGWRAAGGEDGPEILRAAAALELFQAFALIHDDIMDESDTRRGEPALHRGLASLHAGNAWRGEPGRFGTSLAILCGDLCLAYSDELLHHSGFGPDRIAAALGPVHAMREEVMIGQSLDVIDSAAGGSLAGALRIIRLKTGKYTVERPLQVGAALAGASADLLAALSDFAIPLGEAFQLRDDVLGVFGDPEVTGKPALDDLREGKPTALVAIARQEADARQAKLLDELYGTPLLSEDGAAALREVFVETGALRQVEEMIRARHDRSSAAAANLAIGRDAREMLLELASAAAVRTS